MFKLKNKMQSLENSLTISNNSYVIAFGENAVKMDLNGVIDPKKTHVYHLNEKELSYKYLCHLSQLYGKKNLLVLNKRFPIIFGLPEDEKRNIFLYAI